MTGKIKNIPLVTVIIASYNGEKFLEDCLGSLIKSTYPNLDILIVDDGSTDNSKKIFAKYLKLSNQIRIVKNEKNIGLSKSRNKAIRESKGDVLLFLDNDTEIMPDTIDKLIAALYSSPKLGAVQALLVDFEKRDLIQVGGLKLIPYTGWGIILDQWKERKIYKPNGNVIGLGAALAVNREVVMKINGFDEEFFHYTDDLDFSYRIWVAGYQIAIVPDAIVYHWTKPMEMRKNVHDNNEKVYFHMGKNSIRFILKNYDVGHVFFYLPICVTILVIRAMLVLIRRREASCVKGTWRAIIWNIGKIFNTLKKRRSIQNYREVSDSYLFSSVMVDGSPMGIYNRYFTWAKLF